MAHPVTVPSNLTDLPRPEQAALDRVALRLTQLAEMAGDSLALKLQQILAEDRRQIIADEEGWPARQALVAALIRLVDELGPEDAKLSIYLSRSSGTGPLRDKTQIERFRKML